MYSHLASQILLVLLTVTSYCGGQLKDCSRVFHFDFEKNVQQGAGGIWQGQEGEVKFRGGKAWLDGNGSLIYPFFSNNDLRPSFAFSFKFKPAQLETKGRVAIITNDLAPGFSTLTVFHNKTSLGVKVVETVEPWPWTAEAESSRKVELTVDYTKHNKRAKRSVDEDVKSVTAQVPNDTRRPQATRENNSSSTSGEQPQSTSGLEEPGESGRDDASGTHETPISEALIAVRRLFRLEGGLLNSETSESKVNFETTSTSTTTTTMSPTEENGNIVHRDSEDSDNTDQVADNSNIPNSTTQAITTTTPAPISELLGYVAHPRNAWSINRPNPIQERTSLLRGTIVLSTVAMGSGTTTNPVPTPGTAVTETPVTLSTARTLVTHAISHASDSNNSDDVERRTTTVKSASESVLSGSIVKHINSSVVKPPSSFIVKPVVGSEVKPAVRQSLVPLVIGHVTTTHPRHASMMRHLSVDAEVPRNPQRNRFLVVPNIFRGMPGEDPDEIDVRVAQDNGVLSLQVGNSAIEKTNVGSMEHMKAPRSPLRVGVGDGLRPFRGSFDEFIMYDCAPENFFKKEGSPYRTQADVWTRKDTSEKER